MCGIFAFLNLNMQTCERNCIEEQFMKGQSRGPENSVLDCSHFQVTLGFHRLAINGLNTQSNQPIVYENITLICNGEIYNYKKLYEVLNIQPQTESDCEVIIHLYLKYGIERTLGMLDGVFAFVLYDHREEMQTVYVARDPLGVRPLYQLYNLKQYEKSYSPKEFMRYENHYRRGDHYVKHQCDEYYTKLHRFGFASELKCLEYFYNEFIRSEKAERPKYQLTQFEPGTYSVYKQNEECLWLEIEKNKIYFVPSFPIPQLCDVNIYKQIQNLLVQSVEKRCETTQREVACLLSGGLDSSLITALVARYFSKKGVKIETYSIGLENSVDLHYAKLAADFIGTNHTQIIVTEQEMFDAIPEVIKAIESYDTTTIRASIGNYLIGKYISTHSKAKVIFNGDGSDELFGGYLYFNKCPDDIEFDGEIRRLLKDIHLFDVLRSDKSISSNGLEPRTPFLDKTLVNYVLSIPPELRNHIDKNGNVRESKFILRESFKDMNILPEEILWRPKEAFSDGVSSQTSSLYTILQNKIAQQMKESGKPNVNADLSTEKEYYKYIFNRLFPECQHIIPYYWMPKYTDAVDPSARTLDFYNK